MKTDSKETTQSTNGKGDKRRPEDPDKFRSNYDKINWGKRRK